MSRRLEDAIGKWLIIAVFWLLCFQQIRSIIAFWQTPDAENWHLTIVRMTFTLIFVAFVVGLTAIRLPSIRDADGIEPRISAIAGAFALMLLVFLPRGQPPVAAQYLATAMVVIGTLLSIVCVYFLGRSLSIMASARKLVTGGPYSIVRHPLYVAEAITITGVIIGSWSVGALLLGMVQFAFQFRRMFNEERVLREAFPEYEAYARQVPMVVPFMSVGRLKSAR